MRRAQSVDDCVENAEAWNDELGRLRDILRATKLKEEIKWGAPCYTHSGKNIAGFKSFFGLWFHQGALLKDDTGVLINAQEGKTKALRQWRMSLARDIKPAVIKRYVNEAISNVATGRSIKADRTSPIVIPDELRKVMRRSKGATAAFRKLRPGLQRNYTDYISAARRDETKLKRIDNVLPMILSGVGLNDRYR